MVSWERISGAYSSDQSRLGGGGAASPGPSSTGRVGVMREANRRPYRWGRAWCKKCHQEEKAAAHLPHPWSPPATLTPPLPVDSINSPNWSLGKGLRQHPVLSRTLQMASLDPNMPNVSFLPRATQHFRSARPALPSNEEQSVFSSSKSTSILFVCVSGPSDSACPNKGNLEENSRL